MSLYFSLWTKSHSPTRSPFFLSESPCISFPRLFRLARKHLTMGVCLINNRKFTSHSFGNQVPVDSLPGKDPLWIHRWTCYCLLSFLMVKRASELVDTKYEDTNVIHRHSAFMTQWASQRSSQCLNPKYLHVGDSVSTYLFKSAWSIDIHVRAIQQLMTVLRFPLSLTSPILFPITTLY